MQEDDQGTKDDEHTHKAEGRRDDLWLIQDSLSSNTSRAFMRGAMH